jgi:hypothetical protein
LPEAGARRSVETKLRSVLLFDVAEDTPHRVLTEATDAGVAAAREVLGAPPATNGALGSAREGKKRVRVEMGIRAAPAVIMEAERAFAAAFVGVVAKRGHAVEQV